MTITLYEKEPYLQEFDAVILSATAEKELWDVVLDKTCFYPESGGQPSDKGTINNIPVVRVKKVQETIHHYIGADPGTRTAHGVIDWQRRYDFMQQHTGQHIISAALMKVGRFKTVSVHLGDEYSTIEIESPELSGQQLMEVEMLSNRIINQNIPVEIIYTTADDVHRFSVRRLKEQHGEIRLVRIGDFDCVGCGGTHCRSTGEVGCVKATGTEKIRGNVRITWKIGARAYRDYHKKNEIVAQLKRLFSTHEDTLVQCAEKFHAETAELKRRCTLTLNRLAGKIADELWIAASETAVSSGVPVKTIVEKWHNEDEDLLNEVVKNLLDRNRCIICFINMAHGSLRFSIGCTKDITLQFNRIRQELLPLIGGKGGGSAPLWRGSGITVERVDDFLTHFKESVHAMVS